MSLTVDVYSDLICPWCFIGKKRLEKALGMLGGRDVTVRWHPFQLNPGMPPEGKDRKAYRSAKFGSWERSRAMDAEVTAAGRGEGITFDYDKVARTPNTLDSHRLVWLAGERGVQDAVVEALFTAYFTDGRNMNDRETLSAVAVEAGLDRTEVNALLEGDAGLEAVRAGEQEGRRLGVAGVPFVVINGSVALSGAQSPETFRTALEQAAGAVPAEEPMGVCGLDPASGRRSC